MRRIFKTLVQNKWEAVKSPVKMEFYTEPWSQCRPVTTAGSKAVRGRKKSSQNGILDWTANVELRPVTTAGDWFTSERLFWRFIVIIVQT